MWAARAACKDAVQLMAEGRCDTQLSRCSLLSADPSSPPEKKAGGKCMRWAWVEGSSYQSLKPSLHESTHAPTQEERRKQKSMRAISLRGKALKP